MRTAWELWFGLGLLLLHLCAPKRDLETLLLPQSATGLWTEAWTGRARKGRDSPSYPATPGRQDSATRAQQMFSECRVKFCLFPGKN